MEDKESKVYWRGDIYQAFHDVLLALCIFPLRRDVEAEDVSKGEEAVTNNDKAGYLPCQVLKGGVEGC